MTPITEPKLAAPGAGLPPIEWFFARRLFARKRRTGTREMFNEAFRQERRTICELVDRCDATLRGRRILIKRLRGLEDSSRHWSVWMTLDHLRITNEAFAHVIVSLASGSVPVQKASTADVKPSPAVGPEAEERFEASCDRLLTAVESVADLKTATRYAHPWFGPLNAAGWHALSALHMEIHRRQIEKILSELARTTKIPVNGG